MASNSDVLREKAKEVSQSMGAYVFTIGDHFIQIASINKGEVYCEAVSHHFMDSLSPALEPSFRSLGYTIDESSNYSKTYSASDEGIQSLISDAEVIFRDYYRTDHNLPFEVMDAE
jgi:hypothetical protein